MTKPLPFTQASIVRRIAAAQKAGLRVKGIAADGTVLVNDGDGGDNPLPHIAVPLSADSKWRDPET